MPTPVRFGMSVPLLAFALAPALVGSHGCGGDSSLPVPAPALAPAPALDETFGGSGYVHAGYAREWIEYPVLAELDDGRILIAGSGSGFAGGALAVRRHLPDGSADPTFGTDGGVGFVTCTCSGFSGSLRAFRRAANGALILAGSAVPAKQPGKQRYESLVVLRLREDGTLGDGAGDAGLDVVDLGAQVSAGAAAFPAQEGSVFVAGQREGRLFVAAVRERGAALDLSFASPQGWIAPAAFGTASNARAMLVDAQGRLVVAGWVENKDERDLLVLRLLPNGALDPTFGMGGVVRPARPGKQEAGALALLPDGRLLVAADTDDPDARRLLLLALRPDGTPDPAFGADGVALAPIGAVDPDLATRSLAMAVQSGGRVIVAADDLRPFPSRALIARFLEDGTPDPAFGTLGEAAFAIPPGPDWKPSKGVDTSAQVTTLALTRDGKLLLSGMWSSYPYKGFLARMTL